MTHACPIRGCPASVRDNFYMCARHWRMVPRPLQAAVYASYRKEGRVSANHREAVRVVEAVEHDRATAPSATAEPKRERHRWPEEGTKAGLKTERECLRGCRTLRVTFHPEGRRAYMKYCRDGEWSKLAPACEPVEVTA